MVRLSIAGLWVTSGASNRVRNDAASRSGCSVIDYRMYRELAVPRDDERDDGALHVAGDVVPDMYCETACFLVVRAVVMTDNAPRRSSSPAGDRGSTPSPTEAHYLQ